MCYNVISYFNKMNCTIELHDELSQNYINFPFCKHQILNYYTDKQSNCCEQPDITEHNSCLLCINCGQIGNELFKNNFIDFHENRYRIYKKSIYIRKYHIQNVLSDIAIENKLPISRAIINCVCQTFNLINTVLPQVNQDRKRIISIKFIIHKLFVMWKLPHVIQISKSNKTLKYFEEYWNKIESLIGDKLS